MPAYKLLLRNYEGVREKESSSSVVVPAGAPGSGAANASSPPRELKGSSGGEEATPPGFGIGGQEGKQQRQGQDGKWLHVSFEGGGGRK